MYFKHSVAARYESTEREAKHLRFAQAAVQIRQRLRLPEQVAIPGVGLPPPVSYRWDWWTESPPRGPVQTHREKRPLAVMALSLTLSLAPQAAGTWTSAYRAGGGAWFSR